LFQIRFILLHFLTIEYNLIFKILLYPLRMIINTSPFEILIKKFYFFNKYDDSEKIYEKLILS